MAKRKAAEWFALCERDYEAADVAEFVRDHAAKPRIALRGLYAALALGIRVSLGVDTDEEDADTETVLVDGEAVDVNHYFTGQIPGLSLDKETMDDCVSALVTKRRPRKVRERWPTSADLLAWFLYDKLNGSLENEPDPAAVAGWVETFYQTPPEITHSRLDKRYSQFREIFCAAAVEAGA